MASEFLEHLLLFRVCWIRGRLGGGKTLLSYAIAEHLMKMGQVEGVITNFPNVMPSAIKAEDGTLINRAIIFDEAWTHLDSRDSLVNPREYGAYARKIDSYWLFPSVHQIDKRLRSVIVWRSARLDLFNVWIYRWSLELDYDEASGWFLLTNPSRYFGRFASGHVPVDDGGIEKRYRRTMDQLTEGQGPAYSEQLRDYLGALEKIGALEELSDAS